LANYWVKAVAAPDEAVTVQHLLASGGTEWFTAVALLLVSVGQEALLN